MTIIENELRDLLWERSAGLPPPVTAAPGRLTAVRRRVARRRRRAAVGSVLTSVVLVAAGVAWSAEVGLPRRGGSLPAADLWSGDLPVYAGGGRRLADGGREGAVAGDSFDVTFSLPRGRGLMLRASCPGTGAEQPPQLRLELDGRPLGEMTCEAGGAWYLTTDEVHDRTGVREGRTVRLTARVRDPEVCETCSPWSGGRVALGVYEVLPRSEYRFPPRPQSPGPPPPRLRERERLAGRPLVGVDARDVGAEGRVQFRTSTGAGRTVTLAASGPGYLDLEVDGVAVGGLDSWTWDPKLQEIDLSPRALRAFGLDVAEGQGVVVTVVASRFTEERWTVWAPA